MVYARAMFWWVERGESFPTDDLVAIALETHRQAERWLFINMVSSVDGATTVRGQSTPLSDDADRAMFRALRAACDAVLVGAGTVRAEDYGAIRLDDRAQGLRRAAGLEPLPRLVIVSRSLYFEPSARVFEDSDRMPIVFTGADAPIERRRALEDKAEVVVAGDVGVDPARALDMLADRGHGVVLCEGGPTLNASLLEAGLVDEIDLTLSPLVVGGMSHRIVAGATEGEREFRLERVLAGEKMLFLRYVREGSSHPQE